MRQAIGHRVWRWVSTGLLAWLLAAGVLSVINFPWHADGQADVDESKAKHYYDDAYTPPAPGGDVAQADAEYVVKAQAASAEGQTTSRVARFVKQYDLRNKRVLEIGAGSGMLQDLVSD